jgi:hypothetical protein
MSKSSRIVLKFDHEQVANIFVQIWNQSLGQMVQHMNEAVNRQGIQCDLHVEQTKGNEYQFRHKSGNKGIIFVQSNDDIGVKLLDYDSVPLNTRYIVNTPQGFLLMIKTGNVDTKLEYLPGRIEELQAAIEDYDEKIVEAKKAAKKAEDKQAAKEDIEDAKIESDDIPEAGKAEMAVNEDDPATPEGEKLDEEPTGPAK